MTQKKCMVKLDRICAWSLVVIILIYFVSGFGMTKGVIPADVAKIIHDTILPIPSAFAFSFHSAFGIHVALKRWRVYNHAWRRALFAYIALVTIGVAVFQIALRPGPDTEVSVPTVIEL